MSADMNFPQKLYTQKHTLSKPQHYAEGALVLFTIKGYDLSEGLALLTSHTVRRIAIANPKTAPYGKAAFEALQNAHLEKKLKKKFVYGESISQTLSYTIQASDIGIVAKSALFSPQMKKYKEDTEWVDLDTTLYTPIKQGMVLLKRAKNRQECRLFYDFLLTPQAKNIFQKYGYR
jgi:molybdate transport system substrate-binding protein